MHHLVAKVKRKNALLKVLSNETIFSIPPDLDNNVIYNPATLLEEDQWYRIENFSIQNFSIDFIRNEFNSASHAQITIDEYSKIDYLCSVQDQNYYFQKMTANHLLKKQWFSASAAPTLVKESPIIIINNFPDGVYDRNDNILYFKKLTAIKSIFRGIEILYREATDVETQTFLNNDFLRLTDGFNIQSVTSSNRKRIALVQDTLNTYTQDEKDNIHRYIQPYCQNINYQNGAFEINNDNDLKHIIYGIDQRFYTTHLRNEKRIANSIINIA